MNSVWSSITDVKMDIVNSVHIVECLWVAILVFIFFSSFSHDKVSCHGKDRGFVLHIFHFILRLLIDKDWSGSKTQLRNCTIQTDGWTVTSSTGIFISVRCAEVAKKEITFTQRLQHQSSFTPLSEGNRSRTETLCACVRPTTVKRAESTLPAHWLQSICSGQYWSSM